MWFDARRLALATAVLILGFGGGSRAVAGLVINTPAGLTAGDTFRVVFVTDATTTATSTDIAFYNNFVNTDATNEAGGGAVTYNGVALTWSAIASTPSTNAIDNIGVTGAPVYLASGILVQYTDSTVNGLWSGGSLQHAIDNNLTGTFFRDARVWTGTDAGGDGAPTLQLGNTQAIVGSTAERNSWEGAGGIEPTSSSFQLFGISQELTVSQTAVPEPSSLCMGMVALAAGAAVGFRRRRRGPRRQNTRIPA